MDPVLSLGFNFLIGKMSEFDSYRVTYIFFFLSLKAENKHALIKERIIKKQMTM